jgi:hypothetical protein
MKKRISRLRIIISMVLLVYSGNCLFSQNVEVLLSSGLRLHGELLTMNDTLILIRDNASNENKTISKSNISLIYDLDNSAIIYLKDIRMSMRDIHNKPKLDDKPKFIVKPYEFNSNTQYLPYNYRPHEVPINPNVMGGFYLNLGMAYGKRKTITTDIITVFDSLKHTRPINMRNSRFSGIGIFYSNRIKDTRWKWQYNFELVSRSVSFSTELLGNEVFFMYYDYFSFENTLTLYPLTSNSRSWIRPFMNFGNGLAFRYHYFEDTKEIEKLRLELIVATGLMFKLSDFFSVSISQRFIGSRRNYSKAFFIPEGSMVLLFNFNH